MARLPAGQKPEPLSERMKRYRKDLEASGGRRLIVDLDKEANTALKAIMERDKTTAKDAVSNALILDASKE